MHPLTTKNIDKFGGEEKQKEAARRGPKKAFKKEAHKKTHQKIRARVECGGTAGVGKGKKTKEKKSEEDWCAMSAGIVNDVVIVRELHTESYKNAPSVGSRQKYLSFGVGQVKFARRHCVKRVVFVFFFPLLLFYCASLEMVLPPLLFFVCWCTRMQLSSVCSDGIVCSTLDCMMV